MRILVTGGAGYIGSHTCLELLRPVTRSPWSTTSATASESLRRVEELTGDAGSTGPTCSTAPLEAVFAARTTDAVIHFAGLKAVGESVTMPLRYYHNNVTGTLVLCEVMQAHGVKNLVFSSSATVYGDPAGRADPRGFSALGDQPLRPDQADDRGDPARPARRGPGLEHRPAALLQPGRRPRQRPDRRGPERHPQQPDALSSPRWRSASCRRLRCSATTTPRPTAPASATTSTWSTWPWAIWPRWKNWPRTRGW